MDDEGPTTSGAPSADGEGSGDAIEALKATNERLRRRQERLERENDDLATLVGRLCTVMVLLDDRLRIERFTPAAADLLGLGARHVGRVASDLDHALLGRDLVGDARAAMERIEPRARVLAAGNGRRFSRRLTPCRGADDRIESLVMTMHDLAALRFVTGRTMLREHRREVLDRLGARSFDTNDLQDFMNVVVTEVADTLQLDYCKVLELQPGEGWMLLRAGTGWRDGLVGRGAVDTDPGSQVGHTLRVGGPVLVEDLATETRFSGPAILVEHGVTSGLSCVIRDDGERYGLFGGHTRAHRVFTQEDEDFVRSIADVVGAAIGHFHARRHERLVRAVTAILDGGGTPEDRLAAVQKGLVVELDAVAGETWLVADGTPERLVRSSFHALAGEREADLSRRLGGRDVRHPDDLVVRALSGGEAVAATDLGEPGLFAHDARARELGFTSAVAFPIASRTGTLGVVTLYARQRMFVGRSALRSLERIGRTLGERLT